MGRQRGSAETRHRHRSDAADGHRARGRLRERTAAGLDTGPVDPLVHRWRTGLRPRHPSRQQAYRRRTATCLLARLNAAGELDWSRTRADGSRVHAKKRGSQHRLVAGRPATSRAASTTWAATAGALRSRPSRPRPTLTTSPSPLPWSMASRPSPDAQTTPSTPPGSARRQGMRLRSHRRELPARRILQVVSRRGAPTIDSPGKLRYAVEQTFALLHRFKRLAVQRERRTEPHDAFVSLARSPICYRRPKRAAAP